MATASSRRQAPARCRMAGAGGSGTATKGDAEGVRRGVRRADSARATAAAEMAGEPGFRRSGQRLPARPAAAAATVPAVRRDRWTLRSSSMAASRHGGCRSHARRPSRRRAWHGPAIRRPAASGNARSSRATAWRQPAACRTAACSAGASAGPGWRARQVDGDGSSTARRGAVANGVHDRNDSRGKELRKLKKAHRFSSGSRRGPLRRAARAGFSGFPAGPGQHRPAGRRAAAGPASAACRPGQRPVPA